MIIVLFIILSDTKLLDACFPTIAPDEYYPTATLPEFTTPMVTTEMVTFKVATEELMEKTSMATTEMATTAHSSIPPQQTCSTCAPIYDPTCTGIAYFGCATDSEASISYSLTGSTCTSSHSCPGFTVIMYDTMIGYSLPPAGTTAFCSEADGIWYFNDDGVNTVTSRMRCM